MYKNTPDYDLILCVGAQHITISLINLKYITCNLSPKNIFIITNKQHFNQYENIHYKESSLILIDENTLLDNCNLPKIKDFFQNRNTPPERAAWYFQQFLKMQAHTIVQEKYYLIWDADTIPLKPIIFFDEFNRALIHYTTENHTPYFETLKKVLNLKKQAKYSFISEHMLIDKIMMRTLISDIEKQNPNSLWPFSILESIQTKDLTKSGFSEYETYGNYCLAKAPHLINERNCSNQILKNYRHGTQLFGKKPSTKDLFLLAQTDFHYITFETWETICPKNISKNKRLAQLYYFITKLKFPKELQVKISQIFTKKITY